MKYLIEKLSKDAKLTLSLSTATIAFVGGIFFVSFIISPSEPRHQLFLGLSAERFATGVVFLFLLLVCIAALWILQKEYYRQVFINRYALQTTLSFYAISVILIIFILISQPSMVRVFHSVAWIQPLKNLSPRLIPFTTWLIFASTISILTLRLINRAVFSKSKVIHAMDTILKVAIIFIGTYFLYVQFAFSIGWVGKTKSGFFDILAQAFLEGHLYLKNPPYTHDLTLYQGRWYVPMPPLPAIILIPLVYWRGVDNISTSYFSIFFSALNGLFLYLIFQQLKQKKWLVLSDLAISILVILFLFGTPHLWVGISGRGWFLDQILAVFFLLAAIYITLKKCSAWLIGIFVGTAMLARPNAILTTPFLLGIHLQMTQDELKIRKVMVWILKVSLPIFISIGLALVYNYLRFDSVSDFGYVTINGDPTIVQNAQQWGIFSHHFILTNLKVMFFKLPFLNLGGRWPILPSATGMSIFLTTPALVYLFRRYNKDWWVIGAWVAVLFNSILLSMYHNTGAHQFGYRYILDFIAPLILLLGFNLEKKIPWHFLLLTILSIIINLYGTNWFMNG